MKRQRSVMGPASSLARRLFRTLNKVTEPLVRRGLGSPFAGPGLVVVETTGNRTGLPRRVPLLGVRTGNSVLVSTARPNGAWVRNLERDPRAEVWSAGCARPATATVHRLPAGAYVHLRDGRDRSVSPTSVAS